MNEEEFASWKERIANLMRLDGETDDFIEYLLSWFHSMKGRKEMELIEKYHPTLGGKSEEEIYEFMGHARYFVEGLSDKEFRIQNFDSAFFLYRKMIRKEFQEEGE